MSCTNVTGSLEWDTSKFSNYNVPVDDLAQFGFVTSVATLWIGSDKMWNESWHLRFFILYVWCTVWYLKVKNICAILWHIIFKVWRWDIPMLLMIITTKSKRRIFQMKVIYEIVSSKGNVISYSLWQVIHMKGLHSALIVLLCGWCIGMFRICVCQSITHILISVTVARNESCRFYFASWFCLYL